MLKPNQSVEDWEESKLRIALQLKVKLVLTSIVLPKKWGGCSGEGVVFGTHHQSVEAGRKYEQEYRALSAAQPAK